MSAFFDNPIFISEQHGGRRNVTRQCTLGKIDLDDGDSGNVFRN
jgi:hypothetical protein